VPRQVQQFRLKSFHLIDEQVVGVLRKADPHPCSAAYIADALGLETHFVHESLNRLQISDRVREGGA
jgi:hypothetical protein